jgi:hypothetical protein
MEKKVTLWLDDVRDPYHWIPFSRAIRNKVYWAKSYDEFVNYIKKNGLPDFISFDHDLGDYKNGKEYTGYDCAKWLVNYCLDNNLDLPEYNVHSANSVGKENIERLLENFKKNRNK